MIISIIQIILKKRANINKVNKINHYYQMKMKMKNLLINKSFLIFSLFKEKLIKIDLKSL